MPIIRTLILRLAISIRLVLSLISNIYRQFFGNNRTPTGYPKRPIDISMKITKSIQGQWFIFGDNNSPAVGVLNYDPDTGLLLDVQRHRPANLAQAIGGAGFVAPQIIRGIDAHGTQITLFGCLLTSWNFTAALDNYKILSSCTLIGAHYNQFTDAIFNNVSASYSILDAWLTRSAVVSVPLEGALSGYALQPQPDINIQLGDGTTVSLTMSLGHEFSFSSVTLSQTQFVNFTRPNNEAISSLINNYIFKFGKLLSFLTRTDVYVDQISVPQNAAMPREIEWLSSMAGSTKAKRTLHPQEALVSYHEIAGHFPALVVDWFNYYEDMEAILNLYFTATRKSDIPTETRFLLIAQALEAYHNRSNRFVSEIQATDVFRARRDAILVLVADGAERTWLRDKLNFANLKTGL